MEISVTYIACTSLLMIVLTIYSLWIIRSLQRTIQSQQDTINKLLNREPVTYKEVGQEKPKLDTDRPIAWAGAIADRDEI